MARLIDMMSHTSQGCSRCGLPVQWVGSPETVWAIPAQLKHLYPEMVEELRTNPSVAPAFGGDRSVVCHSCLDAERRATCERLRRSRELNAEFESQKRVAAANRVTRSGNTVLIRAVRKCDTIGIVHLLKEGADPNLAGKKGRTPLMHAVSAAGAVGSGLRAVAMLLNAGADPCATDDKGRTLDYYRRELDGDPGATILLKHARKHWASSALSILLSGNAKAISHVSAHGITRLAYAIYPEYDTWVDSDEDGKTLYDAVVRRDADEVRNLVEAGHPLNVDPLMWAACSPPDLDMMRLLLDLSGGRLFDPELLSDLLREPDVGPEHLALWFSRGADPNWLGELGRLSSPLCYATEYGHTHVIDWLLEAGANINPGPHRTTPLHTLIQQDYPDEAILDFLASRGARAIKGPTGRTPLHENMHPHLVDKLVACGGDVNARDSQGRTPLDYVEMVIQDGRYLSPGARTRLPNATASRLRSSLIEALKRNGGRRGEDIPD